MESDSEFAAASACFCSSVVSASRWVVLSPWGSNWSTSELIATASALPLDKADSAWKQVYARVVELAWFAPVAAIDVCYFAANSIKAPQPGQSLVIDLANVKPAT